MTFRNRSFATLALLFSFGLHRELEGQAIALHIEPTASVRLEGEGGTAFAPFGRVASASFTTRGRLVIADGALNRISLFDRDGRWMRSVGRDGSGPAEFTRLEWVGSCGEDATIAFDLMTRRFTVLDDDLKYLSAFRVPGAPTAIACSPDRVVWYLELARALEPPNQREWRGAASLFALSLSSGAPRVIDTVPLGDLVNLNGGWMSDPGGRRTTLAPGAGFAAVATGDGQALAVYTADGRIGRRLTFPARPRSLTEAERRVAAEEFMARVPDHTMREAMVTNLLKAPHSPVEVHYRRVIADPHGLYWIQRSVRGAAELRVEVVDGTGRQLLATTIGADGELLAVGSDHLAVLRSTGEGADVVDLYRIRRP